MPVDREKAVGASLGEREGGWEADDVSVSSKERGAPIITNAAVTLRS